MTQIFIPKHVRKFNDFFLFQIQLLTLEKVNQNVFHVIRFSERILKTINISTLLVKILLAAQKFS